MKRLRDRICVITGGASGIGHASVLRFLAEGAHVVLADVNEEAGRRKVDEIAARGDQQRIRFCRCDVSDEVQVMRMIRYTVQEFGRIDCLFNNAGIGGAYGRLIDTRVEDWDRTQVYLLRSTFLCVKHAALAMIRQDTGGSIVNNAALAARFGDLAGAAYSAAKAGVVNLTKTAAVQLAENRIRVNVILPGFISTPLNNRGGDSDELEQLMISKQAWPETGRPEHVASVAAFLASDESRFITGAEIVVDGGYAAGGRGLYRSGHPLGKAIADRMQEAGVRHF
ncbi:MAG: SDR family oxidoreductase, partial [Planctomycetes bacterium]|nr:SDR family oxidoreductase [Planctomycetota bacterium]